jgi:hypothetical protein
MTSQNMHFLEINRADIKQHHIVTGERDLPVESFSG